jgi:ketopantoate reductase
VPETLRPVISRKETVLVVIQNGIGDEQPFREAFPGNTIITCVARLSLLQPRESLLTMSRRGLEPVR